MNEDLDNKKYEDPFNPICNDFAKKFDDACKDNDLEKIELLLAEAEDILKTHDEPSYASLFYSVGTSLSIMRDKRFHPVKLDEQVIKLNKEALWYFRHAEALLKQVEVKESNKPFLDGLLLELFVNTGNAYHFCHRECTAMDYYSRALDINPGFGMALGNIGRALEHYAIFDSDIGHQEFLIKKAYKFYKLALLDNRPMTHQNAKEIFAAKCKKLEAVFGTEALNESIEYDDFENDQSDEEKEYRRWCLENHLFLNTLNDLPELKPMFAADPLQLPTIKTPVSQNKFPFVFEMFNMIKEEYIYSRYLLFDVCNSNYEICFADKQTHLNDPFNYSNYSIRLEKLKTVYRTVYSLLDHIAYLLNAYFKLGINQGCVNFDKIWKPLKNYESNNIGLNALHWIWRDFKEKYNDADDSAYAKKLKDLRNALEHKFVAIHSDDIADLLHKPGEDYVFRISEDHLFEYSMFLMKIVREAIIETTVAINIEEQNRNVDNRNTLPITLHEYSDDYKR